MVHEWAARSGGSDVANGLLAMLAAVPTEQLATRADLERMAVGLSDLPGELLSLGRDPRVFRPHMICTILYALLPE